MADLKELDEAAKKQIAELNSAKTNLISALDRLVINEGKTFNLPKNIGNNIPNSFRDNFNTYISFIKDLIENNKIEGFTTDYLKGLKLNLDDLFKLNESILTEQNLEEFNAKSRNIINRVSIIYDEFKKYLNLKNEFNQLSFNAISESLAKVNDELSTFRRLRNIADTGLTENIYKNATKKYEDLAKDYRDYFYSCIIAVLAISIMMISLKPFWGFGVVEFWLIKFSIFIIGVLLISYYLKQSAHYQKLADQNYQVQVELQAYPSFMDSIPSNEAAAIRKELALKYFGKEIDSTPHKDMSNLVSDQMKNTTELVKAATDAINAISKKP